MVVRCNLYQNDEITAKGPIGAAAIKPAVPRTVRCHFTQPSWCYIPRAGDATATRLCLLEHSQHPPSTGRPAGHSFAPYFRSSSPSCLLCPLDWSPMENSHSGLEAAAFRCASAVFAFAGFLLSALSALILAILRTFVAKQEHPRLLRARHQTGKSNRRTKSPMQPATDLQKQPATPTSSASDATLVEDAANARVRFRDTLIVYLHSASPDMSTTRRVHAPHGLSKAAVLESTQRLGSTASPGIGTGETCPMKCLAVVGRQSTQPLQLQKSSEAGSRPSGADKPATKPAVLRSASMPHLPQVKRSPKFTSTLGATHDKVARKCPTKVSKAIPHEAPHYVALPGLTPPAGYATGQSRKAGTTSGVRFEQYHLWSRKAKSLRNLKAAQPDVTTVRLSVSTNPASQLKAQRQATWHAATKYSISSVSLSAAEAEKATPRRVGGDGPPIRQRSISGGAIAQQPLRARRSSEQSPPLARLFARSMSTTALTELATHETAVPPRRPLWLARFRRRARSVSSDTSG